MEPGRRRLGQLRQDFARETAERLHRLAAEVAGQDQEVRPSVSEAARRVQPGTLAGFQRHRDCELPGGIQAVPTAREGEVMYWLPQQKELVVGDVLLGAGAKPNATSEPLRLCPENWLEGATTKQLVKSLLPLLDLPVERILVSHGDPVLQGGKEVLRALIAPEKEK